MTAQLSHPGHRPGRRLIILTVLLVLSLGLATWLALQSIATARRHRATAQQALSDYAGFGAFVLASQIRRQLGDAVTLTLATWTPGRTGIVPRGAACAGGNTFFEERDGALRFAGPRLPAAQQVFLGESLLSGRADANVLLAEAGWRLRFVLAPAGSVDGYFIVRRGGLAGFSVCFRDSSAASGPTSFRQVMLRQHALPPTFTRDLPADSLFSITLTAGARELYTSPVRYASTYTGTAAIGTEFGDLSLRLDLNPAQADHLIIGGLPRAQSPLALGLLGVSILLVVTALMQMRREYELIAIRSDFVSSVSHELRTPLSQILIFTELLKLGRLRTEAERERSIEIIDQEARRLIRLVENVTHFSRGPQAPRTSVPITALGTPVQEALEAFRPLAEVRGATLSAELPAGIVARVEPHAFRQILLNLLDNAIKYGPREQIVRVTLRREGEQTRLMVDDQGPGIPREERERIWEGYYRLPREASSAVAGSGIGLAVVRALVLEVGGRAWVEETGTGGARFVVDLPGGGPAA